MRAFQSISRYRVVVMPNLTSAACRKEALHHLLTVRRREKWHACVFVFRVAIWSSCTDGQAVSPSVPRPSRTDPRIVFLLESGAGIVKSRASPADDPSPIPPPPPACPPPVAVYLLAAMVCFRLFVFAGRPARRRWVTKLRGGCDSSRESRSGYLKN